MQNYVAVITTYNRKEKLVQAIKYLEKQTFLPKKIIIIDNHSSDKTNELMKNYKDNNLVDYIRLDENIGGAGGFYEGIRNALKYHPDYIALSDDDAWYDKEYFQNIKRVSNENPNIKAFIGVAEDLDTKNKIKQGSLVKDLITLKESNDLKNNIYCNSASFCGFVFKANLIKEIGFPRKDFFIWLDDKEYSLRISKVSKILMVNNAIIFHPEQKRNKNGLIPYWKNYYGFRNSIVVRKEYTTNKFLSNIYNVKLLLKHSISIVLTSKYKNERMKYLKSYWIGFFDAYLGNLGKNNKFLP